MASTITIDKTIVKAGETAWISLTFPNNETMYRANGLVRFLTVTGGSLNHGTLIRIAAGTNTYRVQFIPTEGLEKSDAKVRDDSPNDESDGELTFAVDTLRPTVASASIAKSDLRLGEKTTITITFSERVTSSSFTLEDLQVDAGKTTLNNLHRPPPLAARPGAPGHPARDGPACQPETDQPRRHHRCPGQRRRKPGGERPGPLQHR